MNKEAAEAKQAMQFPQARRAGLGGAGWAVPGPTTDTPDKAERIVFYSWALDSAFVNRKDITKWLLGPC